MAETIKIGGELESMATGKIVAAASAIKDKSRNKTQEAINGDVEAAIADISNQLEDKPIVKTEDNGFCIVAHGNRANKATAQNAFAEGGKTEASGIASHAEGSRTYAEGDGSHAEGSGTESSGTGSHAEGYSTLARGVYSHVEGNHTETVDSSAHAEGENTVAYGIASHAEGSCIWSEIIVSRAYTAGDSYLYVEQKTYPGFVISSDTQTVGVQNCVLQEQDGDYKLTLNTPFTENFPVNEVLSKAPSAYGSYSHREGNHTVAKGNSSHAEGDSSKAVGDYSHAEGLHTKTTNIAEHASGKYNKSTPNVTQFSVGIGADEENRANAYEVTTDGKMYVKGVGGYDGTNIGGQDVKALGDSGWVTVNYADVSNAPVRVSQNNGYSLGYGSSGTPYCSFATGYMTTASNIYSHAEGYYTKAQGESSHAEGNGSKAQGESSHAEGNDTQANGNYSHAEGAYAQANGNYSHAEGSYTNASAATAHAEGDHSTASGVASHAEGYYTTASGNYSHAEGTNTKASGVASHTEGTKTKAIGDYSHAEGAETTASGKRTHAEGEGRFVQGAFSLYQAYSSGTDLYIKTRNLPNYGVTIPQVGYIIQVSSQIRRITDISYQGDGYIITIDSALSGSLSTGTFIDYFTGAVGDNSHSEGYYTNAIGNNSHAEGYSTYAQGDYSHTEGYYTQTTNASEHAEGTYNLSTPNKTLSSLGIGSGSGQTPRMNAYEVDLQGNVYIKGIGGYDGTNITASGVESVQEVIARLEQALGGNNS